MGRLADADAFLAGLTPQQYGELAAYCELEPVGFPIENIRHIHAMMVAGVQHAEKFGYESVYEPKPETPVLDGGGLAVLLQKVGATERPATRIVERR